MNILKTEAIGTLGTPSIIEKSMKDYDTDIAPSNRYRKRNREFHHSRIIILK